MKKIHQSWIAIMLLIVTLAQAVGCTSSTNQRELTNQKMFASSMNQMTSCNSSNVPKYIFLFIGDGMSYPQVQLTNYYVNAVENQDHKPPTSTSLLNFMKFPITGSVQTYNRTSFCPDSASTGTAIATGNKTATGILGMDESCEKSYETIAEKLKKQLGYKIGMITSVNVNHATPGAFYAHQPSRKNYYEIGLDLIKSQFNYFAGGGLRDPIGKDENQPNLYELAKGQGYQVIRSNQDQYQWDANHENIMVIGESLYDSDTLAYEIDRKKDDWKLSDYVEQGIQLLDNDTGFFMMVEGGKIDWACHANDAATMIHEVLAFEDGISKAIEFYNKHPEETLILVTADHESGGLTIGYAATEYETHLENYENQKISFEQFNREYVESYKKEKTDFLHILNDVANLFGLTVEQGAKRTKNEYMILSLEECEQLKEAYELTLYPEKKNASIDYLKYGNYEPITMEILHILNHKSGIDFSTYAHTGLPVPVYALGVMQCEFRGSYDNTDIYRKLANIMGIQ